MEKSPEFARSKIEEDPQTLTLESKNTKQEVNEPTYQIHVDSGDLIPEGKDLTSVLSSNNKNNKFYSNNQVYTKKDDIEHGTKSHLEYLKIIRENKDPFCIQSKGLQKYTMEEIKKHNQPDDLWMVVDGNVYDLTKYLDYHPGGPKKLMLGAGKDASSLFHKHHPWVNHKNLVGKLQIGYLTK